MRKIFLTAALMLAFSIGLVSIGFVSTAHAEREIIEADGSYVMDSRLDETPAVATARAREEAKRSAVEQAGVYIQAYTKVIDYELDQDEIRTVAAKFLQVLEEKPSLNIIQDNLIEFKVHIKALVDTSNNDMLKAMMEDKTKLEEMTARNVELQNKYDELSRQMEQLKREYNSADDTRKTELKRAAAINDARFRAAQELEEGNNLYNAGDYYSALERYTRALALDANYADALNNRGNTYAALGQYQNALKDLQTALPSMPDNAFVHNNLGGVYVLLNRYDEALDEYNQALALKPNYATAYYNRGAVYYRQGKYSEALSDARRALEFNPSDAAFKALLARSNAKLGR